MGDWCVIVIWIKSPILGNREESVYSLFRNLPRTMNKSIIVIKSPCFSCFCPLLGATFNYWSVSM